MALKLKCVILSAIFLLCIQTKNANAVCHLDHMKRYALHSCEMLIDALKDHYSDPHKERLRRDILEPNNSTGNYYDENRHIRPTHLRMQDRSFPAGGYIVVDHMYAKILRMAYPSTYHVIPKTLFDHQRDGRNKRHRHKLSDFNEMKNDITYRRRKRNGHHPTEEIKELDDKTKSINFTYCCVNKCKPYDLCEL